MRPNPLFLRFEDSTALQIDGMRIQTIDHLIVWHAFMLESRRIARVWVADEMVVARINHGAWTVLCPACTAGVLTHQDWRIAACPECGAVYKNVVFPDAEMVKALERLLLVRPRPNQNWVPTETLEFLARENMEHGVPF